MSLNKRSLIIVLSFLILLTIFLFSKRATSEKIFIGQNEYSVYSKSYFYAELLCAFSFFDCERAGVIYLYDEIEEEVIESVCTNRVGAIKSLKWHESSKTIYFTANDIDIKNSEWILPRSLKKSNE